MNSAASTSIGHNAPTRLQPKDAMFGVIPDLYKRGMPNVTKEGAYGYIMKFERNRGYPKTREQAIEIFTLLRRISYTAEHRGDQNNVIVRYHAKTRTWRSAKVPILAESLGRKRTGKRGKQSESSYRFKLADMPACSKDDALLYIATIFNCHQPSEYAIFHRLRKSYGMG